MNRLPIICLALASIIPAVRTDAQTIGIECVANQLLSQTSAQELSKIASSGNLVAYTHGNDFRIAIYDATDPTNPILESDVAGLGYNPFANMELAMSDSLLAVSGSFFNEIRVIDISDPTNPTISSTISTSISFILFLNDQLIVHTGSSIDMYDLSNPSSPSLLGSTPDPSTPFGMSLTGNTLCIADRNAGLRLFDIADPSNITETALFPHDDLTWSVTTQGDLAALMTSFPNALIYIDISDPSNPVEIPSNGDDVFASSGAIFVGDKLALPSGAGVRVLNVSSIASPSLERTIAGPDVLTQQRLAPVGSSLAMVSGSFFSLVDLSQNGVQTSEYFNDTPSGIAPNADLAGMFVEGNYAFTFDAENDFFLVLDVSDPANPSVASSLPFNSDASASTRPIAYANGVVYLSGSNEFIGSVDVSDPLNPNVITMWDASAGSPFGNAAYLAITGDYLYALPLYGDLNVFDVSDPANPIFVTSYSIGSSFGNFDLAVSENWLVYITNSEGGGGSFDYLNIFDISDPANPVGINPGPNELFGSLIDNFYGSGLAIEGNTMFLTTGGIFFGGDSYVGSLAVYNLASVYDRLDNIRFEPFDSSFGDGGKLGQILLDGDSAYVVSRYTGGTGANQSISLFNIADPNNIKYVGSSGATTRLPDRHATKQGDLIYMAGGLSTTSDAVAIFDASTCAICPADLTNDGTLNFFDISAFLNAFNTQDPIADFTDDGIYDFFDVSAFLQAFNTGCP